MTPSWNRSRAGRFYALLAFLAVVGAGTGCWFDPCSIGDPTPPVGFITTDRYQLARPGNPGAIATLRAVPLQENSGLAYRWSAYDPAGVSADRLLDTIEGPATRLSAGDLDGPYAVYCLISDPCGRQYTVSVVLQVGGAVGLDVTTERLGVIAGGGPLGQATIHLNPRSGTPPFNISWTCTGPDGRIDNDRLNVSNPLAPVFTSSTQTGTYILTADVVDSHGAASVESVIVIVGQILGLDVIASRVSVLPGGGQNGRATLLATPIGGTQPYRYDWEVIGPDGQSRNNLLWDTTVRSPIFESDASPGTYIIRCAVTDTNGTVLIGSTNILVGRQIALDVTADRLTLPASGPAFHATLSADIHGGRGPFTTTWQVVGPDGVVDDSRLNATSLPTAIFTPGDRNGLYLIRCTAWDADGVSATDSLALSVGNRLGLTTVASKTSLAPGGAPAIGVAQLKAIGYGGTHPYVYSWSVVDPAGQSTTARLNVPTITEPIFTSSSETGLYTVFCMLTDSAGEVAIDSLTINVGQPLNVDVTVDRQTLLTGGGVGGQAYLIASITGGLAPYICQWSVVNPENASDSSRLSSTSVPNPVFTSALLVGTYRVALTVVDALSSVTGDSVELVVSNPAGGTPGQTFSADVSVDQQTVAPDGGTAALTVTTLGGTAPIVYSWTVTDPSGSTDNARLDSIAGAAVTFTSSSTRGTYRIRCTATDAVGIQFTDSVQLTAIDTFLLDLQANVTFVPPGGTITLVANRTGGAASFTYLWSGIDESGAPAGTFSSGPTGPGVAAQLALDDVVNVWAAPAGAYAGAYRISVIVTDATGRSFIDSITVTVSNTMLLDVTASTVDFAPGRTVTLVADRNGGNPSFTFAWTCLNASGLPTGVFGTGSTGPGTATQIATDDATNTWTAPAAGTGTLGTYRILVTATDASGNTYTDSVQLVVRSPLSLNLTASKALIDPSEFVTLVANQTGGEPPYSYAWRATDSAGSDAGNFITGAAGLGHAAQTDQPGDAANGWSAPAVGAYTITCTVTDNTSQAFTDSVAIMVGSQKAFSLDLTADRLSVTPGAMVSLRADRTNGVGPFNYVWAAVNQLGLPAGTLGSAVQSGLADDATNTWTAPTGSGIDGTYRITCTITDAGGSSITATASVEIPSAALKNDVVEAPAALDTTSLLALKQLAAACTGADPGQQILPADGLTSPSEPRNIIITIDDQDDNDSIAGGTARVVGTDARGQSATEILSIAAASGGISTTVGAVPFATVASVDLYNLNGVVTFPPFLADRVSIGVGNKFGLSGTLDATSSVLYTIEDSVVKTEGYTVDATTGRQGISFATAPNGIRSYVVVYLSR